MASDGDQEQHPQAPAQHEQHIPESPSPAERSSAAGEDANDSTKNNTPINGAAQSPGPYRRTGLERASLFPEDDDDNASEASIPSDAASGQIISPTISIPPYWSHSRDQHQSHLNAHTPGHARGVSTASAESVLPPGAITLQDNELDDEDDEYTGRRSNSSELYGRDRNRACWARSVQVTDYVMVNGSATNIGAFTVWNIRVETLNVCYPWKEPVEAVTDYMHPGLPDEHPQALLRV